MKNEKPNLIEKVADVTAQTVVNQLTMTAAAVPAQYFISPFIKASLEKGVSNRNYSTTFLSDVLPIMLMKRPDILKVGIKRRIISAIPVAAFLKPTQENFELSQLTTVLLSSAISTTTSLAFGNVDAEESRTVINAGKNKEAIDEMVKISTKPYNRAMSALLLGARNLSYSIALFASDSLAKNLVDNNQELLTKKTGIDKDNLQKIFSYTFRFASCAATAPFQNLFAGFACGTLDYNNFKMPPHLTRGALARAGGLFIAIESINTGKAISDNIMNGSNNLNFYKKLHDLIVSTPSTENCNSALEVKKQVDVMLPDLPTENKATERMLAKYAIEKFKYKEPKTTVKTPEKELIKQIHNVNER